MKWLNEISGICGKLVGCPFKFPHLQRKKSFYWGHAAHVKTRI